MSSDNHHHHHHLFPSPSHQEEDDELFEGLDGMDNSINNLTSGDNSSHKKKKLLKKAPDAPKRFKSAYICFIGERMESEKAKRNSELKVTDMMKLLANQWKELPTHERMKYEQIAEADKLRYFIFIYLHIYFICFLTVNIILYIFRYYEEMSGYAGPMQVPNKRLRKNPVCLLFCLFNLTI